MDHLFFEVVAVNCNAVLEIIEPHLLALIGDPAQVGSGYDLVYGAPYNYGSALTHLIVYLLHGASCDVHSVAGRVHRLKVIVGSLHYNGSKAAEALIGLRVANVGGLHGGDTVVVHGHELVGKRHLVDVKSEILEYLAQCRYLTARRKLGLLENGVEISYCAAFGDLISLGHFYVKSKLFRNRLGSRLRRLSDLHL